MPRLFLLLFFSLAIFRPVAAVPDPADVAAEPVAATAFVNEVTFDFRVEGQNRKAVVTTGPTFWRFDEPDEGYSFLYNPTTQFYIGLEHRNYTYWTFSWPEVKSAVESSKRYEKHLADLSSSGLTADNPAPTTNAPSTSAPASTPPESTSLGNGDNSGYVWRPQKEKKNIADLDCTRWTGETLSGENCEVWCHGVRLPKVAEAIAHLRTVSEPMALVPVRSIVPDFIFVVYDSLLKAGVTPVLITWGSGHERGTFRLADQRTRGYKVGLFTVPKLYVKTTLVTMDGMTEDQPAPDLRGTTNAPRIDHSDAPPNPFHDQHL